MRRLCRIGEAVICLLLAAAVFSVDFKQSGEPAGIRQYETAIIVQTAAAGLLVVLAAILLIRAVTSNQP